MIAKAVIFEAMEYCSKIKDSDITNTVVTFEDNIFINTSFKGFSIGSTLILDDDRDSYIFERAMRIVTICETIINMEMFKDIF